MGERADGPRDLWGKGQTVLGICGRKGRQSEGFVGERADGPRDLISGGGGGLS